MDKETSVGAFRAVMVLAFICSLLVAGAAVGLRPRQEANRKLDQKKNILTAAGLFQQEVSVDEQFGSIETRLVDLQSGAFVEDASIDLTTFDQLGAALSPDNGREIDSATDIAGIRRQENYSLVYLVKDGGKFDQIVLPVRGKGLWSTMYAYVAVEADLELIPVVNKIDLPAAEPDRVAADVGEALVGSVRDHLLIIHWGGGGNGKGTCFGTLGRVSTTPATARQQHTRARDG